MTERLLVTGGTGFIGSHLAESALRTGHEVNVLGLTDIGPDRKNADYLKSLGAKLFAGSITNLELCSAAMEGVSLVYHLAVAMREAGMADSHFEEINLTGTKNLLDAAVENSIRRFIYCGTIGIFGHRIPGITDESSEFCPGNVYERTKLEAERLVLSYFEEHGLPVVALRPADVYGPRDQRLLKLFRAVSSGRFPLFGSGKGRRHMVYIDDVVDAFEKAATSDTAIGESMIIAGPEVCTLRELIEEIRAASGARRYGIRLPLLPMLGIAAVVEDLCTLAGITPPIYRRRMDFFCSDSAFDTGRAQRLLGWRPSTSLREGVRKTLASYREHNLQVS